MLPKSINPLGRGAALASMVLALSACGSADSESSAAAEQADVDTKAAAATALPAAKPAASGPVAGAGVAPTTAIATGSAVAAKPPVASTTAKPPVPTATPASTQPASSASTPVAVAAATAARPVPPVPPATAAAPPAKPATVPVASAPVSISAPVATPKLTTVTGVAPGAPTDLKPRFGANSVRLAFTPPASTGSSAIVLYTATCSNGTIRLVGSAAASPVVVSGLTQLTNYSCTVSAANAQINGPESAAVTVNLPAPTAFTGRPTAPQNPSLTPGNGSVTLNFSAPASDGSFPILGYSAACTGGASGYAVSSPIIVGGLNNGRSLACTITAINAQGPGAATAEVSGVPVATAGGPVPPSAPSGVTAAAGNTRATLSFVAPASTGGSPITSYQAACNGGGANLFGIASASPVQVHGLTNGTAYSCTVTASNAYGNSAGSAAVTVTPLASLANPVLPPATVTVGVSVPSLAADGTSAVVATVRAADGSLYAGPDLSVSFSSRCAAAGSARLDASAPVRQGQAAVAYQPSGCVGADTITASLNGWSLSGSARVVVSSVGALSAKALLGKQMYFDKGLSASGQQACATCHAPSQNYHAPGQQATQPGGVNGTAVGFRSAPSAAYAALTKPFRFLTVTNQQGTVDNGANGKLGTPRGGQMWDGRDLDLAAQAVGPFTAPHEMANANAAAVRTKLLTRPYLPAFNAVFGTTTAASNADTVLANMASAIAQFETEDRSFLPFNSKYDAVQAGLAALTPQEARGQLLFADPRKGACMGCHTPFSQARQAQEPAMFTDGGFRTIGVPRNWSLPYNNDALAASSVTALGLSNLLLGSRVGAPDHAYYDLGFCGPFRTDSLLESTLCGAFRTPGLRNVAVKGAYFHNGVFGSLNQVLFFYTNRDANPAAVYRRADGTPDLPYNDLPTQYQPNLVVRPPFTPVAGGRMNFAEAQDLISFLCTLTDGYDPANPGAYRQPAQCGNAVRR